MQSKKIEIIINTSEITAGTRGASLGPGAIMTAARKNYNPFFGNYKVLEVPNQNAQLDRVSETKYAKNIAQYALVFNDVKTCVSSTLQASNTPLILAGDHGSAAGTIAGIKHVYPTKRLGVVWIDAHADLHSPYTTPSGNMHGMPLNITLGDDNLACKRNEPTEMEIKLWNSLKSNDTPRVLASDLVFVGVRDTEDEEDYIIHSKKITNYTVEDIRKNGVDKIVELIETQLEACDLIYVSFDVDSMDPDITSYGTGTPVKKGITPEEANTLLTKLASNPKTCCVEFVEVNPCLDNKINTMAETAFALVENVAKSIQS